MAPNRSRSNSNPPNNNQQRTHSPNVNRTAQRQRQHTPNHNAQSATPGHAAKSSQGQILGQRAFTPQRPATSSVDVGMSPTSRYNHNLKVLRRHDPTILSIFDQFSHVCLYHHNGQKWEKKGYEGTMFLFERKEDPKYGFFILNRAGMHDYIHHTPYVSRKPNANESDDESSKREPEVIGLWTYGEDGRDPMGDVMMRLYGYVKRGLPYPEKYRQDLGKRLEETVLGQEHDVFSRGGGTPTRGAAVQQPRQTSEAELQSSISEIDKLFAKLVPLRPTPATATPPTQPTTVSNILDMLQSGKTQFTSKASSTLTQIPSSSSVTGQSMGISLLNSMFATASQGGTYVPGNSTSSATVQSSYLPSSYPPPPLAPPSTHLPQAEGTPQHLHPRGASGELNESLIYSPKPSSAVLPQILTADVIHELMGLPGSRSASSTSSSYSPSSAGAQMKEKGYIADRGEDDGGQSESSNGLEERFSRLPKSQSTIPRPVFLTATSSGNLKGDATPRARSERGLEPLRLREGTSEQPSTPPSRVRSPQTKIRRATERAMSDNNVPTQSTAGDVSRTSAPAAPFQSDADFWPHDGVSHPSSASAMQPILDTRSQPKEEEVVELDFSEIKVLDDPKALEAKGLSRGKSKAKAQAQPRAGASQTNGVQPTSSPATPSKAEKERGRRTKKDKQSTTIPNPELSALVSSPPSSHKGSLNGAPGALNGVTTAVTTDAPSLKPGSFPDVAKDALLKEVRSAGIKITPPMEKKEFVREVLTLVHTDKDFVERLYQGYLGLL